MIEIRMRVAERDVTFAALRALRGADLGPADGPVPLVHVLELARTR